MLELIHVSKTHQQCISYHKSPFNFDLDSCYDNTQCSTMGEHMFAHKILGSGTEKFFVHYIQVCACGPDFEFPQAEKPPDYVTARIENVYTLRTLWICHYAIRSLSTPTLSTIASPAMNRHFHSSSFSV